MWKYLLVASMLVSCKLAGLNTGVDSDLDNIYLEDNSASRRRKATDDELLKVVKLKGCTGHLMHPEYLMTAAHCNIKKRDTYSSGSAIVNRSAPKDITIEEIVENNSSLDFTIAKISWANGFPKDQKFTTLISTSQSDVSFSKNPETGDEVITIGYAADKAAEWGATYSEGRLKNFNRTDLIYNAATINGNSGGGVWKKSDGMLVSLTNGGPQAINRPGWNSSSKDNEAAWNRGVAMWVAYANSAKLRELFPNGRSIAASSANNSSDLANVNSSKIYIAAESIAGGAVIYASVNSKVNRTAICTIGTKKQCEAAGGKYKLMRANKTLNGRKIFESKNINISENSVITIVSLNDENQIIKTREIEFLGE